MLKERKFPLGPVSRPSSICDCLPIRKWQCFLIVGPEEGGSVDEVECYLVSQSDDVVRKAQALWFPASSSVIHNGDIFVLGEQGEVARCDINLDKDVCEEVIEGPESLGPLVSIESAGENIYVAGASRQVYRRDSNGDWSLMTGDILDTGDTTRDLIGFNAVAQIGKDLYAVGLGGEIWRHHDSDWHRCHSPTTEDLMKIAGLPSGEVMSQGVPASCFMREAMPGKRSNTMPRPTTS